MFLVGGAVNLNQHVAYKPIRIVLYLHLREKERGKCSSQTYMCECVCLE